MRKPEWTLVFAAIAGFLNWLVGFKLDWLSPGQAAAWIAAISAVAAVVAAWKTRPVPPQVFTYAVTALAALGTAYGMHWSQEQVASFSTFVLAVMALLTRGQVSPVGSGQPPAVEGETV